MKMKILLLMFVVLLFLCAGQLLAQTPPVYLFPPQVVTNPVPDGFLPVDTRFYKTIYNAQMQPNLTVMVVRGYWHHPIMGTWLYYVEVENDKYISTFFNQDDEGFQHVIP